MSMSFWAASWSISRTRSTSGPFSASSVSAILALVIVDPFVSVVSLQKQPSPKATMAALYTTRVAFSYTTAWDTI
jgi:hypothetical protein